MRNKRGKFLIMGGIMGLVIMCIGITAVLSIFMVRTDHRGQSYARSQEHYHQQFEEGANTSSSDESPSAQRDTRQHSRYDGRGGHHRGGSWLPLILIALGAFWLGKRRGRHHRHHPKARPIHEEEADDEPPQKNPDDLI